jgi:ABC-type polysaccharide/polyol phosphate export permease
MTLTKSKIYTAREYLEFEVNAEGRHVRDIVPFIVQFGLYISPVGFSSSIVPTQWQLLYSLNPMVGVIDGFRWSILTSNTKQIFWGWTYLWRSRHCSWLLVFGIFVRWSELLLM